MKLHCGMSYSYYLKNIFIPILITFLPTYLCSYIITYTIEEGIVRLILTAGICCIIFILLVYRLGMTQEERSIFIQLVKKLEQMENKKVKIYKLGGVKDHPITLNRDYC